MKKLTENLIQQRLKTCTADLSKVQQINLTGRELKDVSLLQQMTGVKTLSLSVNQISSLFDFQFCVNLRELHLRNNQIANLNEIVYLKKLPKLELLVLSENPCAYDPAYRMTVIRNLIHLKELDGIPVRPDDRKEAQKLGVEFLNIPDGDNSLKRINAENIADKGDSENNINQNLKESTTNLMDNLTQKISTHTLTESEIESDSVKIAPSKAIGPVKLEVDVEHEGQKKISPISPRNCEKPIKKEPQYSSKIEEGPKSLSASIIAGDRAARKTHRNTRPDKKQNANFTPKNINILSATLSLIKELDFTALKIINAEVSSRINALTIDILRHQQTI